LPVRRPPRPDAAGPANDVGTIGSPSRRRRWRPSRRQLAAAATVAVLAITGVLVAGGRGSADSGYRTATVATRPVDRTLDRVGTIEPVSQARVAFTVDGTITSVSVNVGDTATTGQQLATLDTSDLEATVAEKQAALNAAEVTLERALNGEDVSGPGATGAGSGGSIVTPSALSSVTSSVVVVGASASASRSAAAIQTAAVSDAELAQARQAVVDAQKEVDASLATARQALDDAAVVCAAVVADSSAGDAQPSSSSTEAGSTSSSSTTSTTSGADESVVACQEALTAVEEAQQHVADDQATLNTAAIALDDLLAQLAEELESAGSSGGDGSGGGGQGGADQGGADQDGSPPQGSGGTPNGTSQGATPPSGSAPSGGAAGSAPGDTTPGATTSSGPTSADLIAYQKAVDAAAAEVTVAEQSLALATVISPITGTVQAVNLAVGDTVTAGSSTATIVVVGDGGYEVTTTVTVDDLGDVAVGQPATFTPDGSDEPLHGEVAGIGVTGTASGSSTTYPVTIGLTDATEGLRNGAIASVSILTGEAGDAIAVPTSAVTVNGATSTVTVLDDGEPTTTVVQVGVMGDVWTEVTDGLEVGDTVVLADLDEALPSSATDSSSTVGFGGGPGGGFGGFP
jgi:multidrug efflux pump subunit AcrA (membrane-fusion protein)